MTGIAAGIRAEVEGYGFALAGAPLVARASGALWWPERRVLCVSDLHLGKSERLARRGGALLPPYECTATLDRLDAEIAALDPAVVISLGDSFDDLDATEGLEDGHRLWLTRLMAGRDWIWIEGNHDPGPLELGGRYLAEARLGTLLFRHIAEPSTTPGEISGHYHPKAGLGSRGGARRPCFLISRTRVILPAFGAYTGGLDCRAPELTALIGPEGIAVLTGKRALPVPVGTGLRA